MTNEKFEELLSIVSLSIQRKNMIMHLAVPAKLKLEITLYYLATGDSFHTLSNLFHIPRNSISVFLPNVLQAISTGLKQFMQVPSSEIEWKEVAYLFQRKWNFPKCCGAIDGKNITIKQSPHRGSEFFNYKKFYSIVLFALIDAEYCFRYVNIGATGGAGDGAIFRSSSFRAALENNSLNFPPDHVILGNEAFPLCNYLMKPYRRKHLTPQQRIFNYRLSRARRVVENAFGILSWKFRVFQKPIKTKVETADKIVYAACALHNWLRMTMSDKYTPPGTIYIGDYNTGDIIPGLWRSEALQLTEIRRQSSNNYKKSNEQIRDLLANYFMNEGSVPWQWDRVDIDETAEDNDIEEGV